MSISSNLVELIRNKPHSQVELEQAALFFLDALASAYAGAATATGRKLIQWAKAEPMNNRSKVFLLAALTHITETDDLHRASATHPGCIVVPCVLVLSQYLQRSDRQALLATVRGFEAICRVGNAVGPAHYRIWHNTATCGPFGSAFAAAELFELDQLQTVYALGNAGTQSSGLWEFLDSGAMSKHLHAGRGSEAGLLAAELARYDFTGPAKILEGEKGFFVGLCPDAEPDKVLSEPDSDWQLLQTSIKPWPSCRHTHPSIDAALEVSAALGNKVIESVHIDTYEAAINVCDRSVASNEYQARFSLQHCAAKALIDGKVDMGSFDQQARSDTQELCQRISLSNSEPFTSSYPRSWGARVSVITADGAELAASRTDCKGDPELALSRDEMIQKAEMLLRYAGFDRKKSQQLCDKVLAMPGSDTPCVLAEQLLDTVFSEA